MMNAVHRMKKNCFEMIDSETTKRVHLKLAPTVLWSDVQWITGLEKYYYV